MVGVNTYKNIDFHCHSTASDGALSPSALVACAAEAGIDCMALTDHDTVAGLDEARQAAAGRGIHFVNGVEISVTWSNKTLHIVGLGIDPGSPLLEQALATVQSARGVRARQIAERLEKLGVTDAHARAQEMAAGGQLTRTHFARLLVEAGVSRDLKQAFKQHLGNGKPANVRAEWLSLDTAITAIRSSGGVSVLAHPLRYDMTGAWRQRMYTAFVEAGGQAVEVSSGVSQQPDELATCQKEAIRHGLMGSVGSDFHGPEQRWIRHGRLAPVPRGVTPIWETFPGLLDAARGAIA